MTVHENGDRRPQEGGPGGVCHKTDIWLGLPTRGAEQVGLVNDETCGRGRSRSRARCQPRAGEVSVPAVLSKLHVLLALLSGPLFVLPDTLRRAVSVVSYPRKV